MHFALIPFFLAVSIPDQHPGNWKYGPEYTFHAKLAGLLSNDFDGEPYSSENVTTTMKCRPNTAQSLLCRLEDLASPDRHLDPTDEDVTPEFKQPFEVNFNLRGIESISFAEPYPIEKLNVVRTIAKELSVGVNLRRSAESFPVFVAKEDFVLGECTTNYNVFEQDGDENESSEEEGAPLNYTLLVLPFSSRKRGSTIVIEKRTEHKKCFSEDETYYISHGVDVKAGKTVTKMEVTGEQKFVSQTKMQVKVPKKLTRRSDTVIQEIVRVELTDVQPAKEKLVPVQNDVTVGLHYTEQMMHNFIL